MQNPPQKPRRSILVHEHENSDQKKERKKSIKWDEEAIEMHDKERGRTMKINEPKTPYVDSLSDEDIKELEAEIDKPDPVDNVTRENTIKNKNLGGGINPEALKDMIIEKSANWDEEHEGQDEEAKHAQFAEKRKKHYNEGMMMKELLKKKWTPDDEEDQN